MFLIVFLHHLELRQGKDSAEVWEAFGVRLFDDEVLFQFVQPDQKENFHPDSVGAAKKLLISFNRRSFLLLHSLPPISSASLGLAQAFFWPCKKKLKAKKLKTQGKNSKLKLKPEKVGTFP